MENDESLVAAFIDGECRGVASPAKVRGAAYVTMSIFGNDTKAKDKDRPVTFSIWDASRGIAYTDAHIVVDGSPVNVTFRQDQVIGSFDQPAIWTKSNNVQQLIPVHKNWNWIAFGVEPPSAYLDHIFSEFAAWQLLIKNRTAFSDYNGAEWNGTLTPKANEMYKLKVEPLPTLPTGATVPQTLSVAGQQLPLQDMPVEIKNGWNWIAYTPLTTMPVNTALSGLDAERGDIIKSQTAMAIYGPYGWEGNLTALEGGHGYMYSSSDKQAKTFIYPDLSASAVGARLATTPTSPTPPTTPTAFTPVEPGLYPNNMTMVIQLREGSAVVDTAEVAAFIGDECRGATRATGSGLYYLVITGEGSGLPMTLRTCIGGQVVDIDDTLLFVSDGNIGTSWEPYVIDLQNVPVGITAVSGSPAADDTDWYTLQGFKIGRRPTQPGIYIHHGEKITIRLRKQQRL